MNRLLGVWILVALIGWPFFPMGMRVAALEEITEYRPLLEQRRFLAVDNPDSGPEGWHLRPGVSGTGETPQGALAAWHIEEGALAVTPDKFPVACVSEPFFLPKECTHVSAVVLARADTAIEALLTWRRGHDILQSVGFVPIPGVQGGRRRLNLPESLRPEDADNAQVELRTATESGKVYWDSVEVLGLFQYAPALSVTVNRVGYEQVAPKLFTVCANFKPREARFTLENEEKQTVYQGSLERPVRIAGAGGTDWGGYYLRGRFSDMEEEGRFRVVVAADGITGTSPWFEIRFDLFWERAFAPALLPFAQRRAQEDDAAGALFWAHTPQDTYSELRLLWDLVRTCSILQGRYGTHPNYALLHSEAYYGASRLAGLVIQEGWGSHLPPEQLSLAAASLSSMARLTMDEHTLREAAQQSADLVLQTGVTGTLAFAAVWDLQVLTRDARYADPVVRLFPGVVLERVEPLLEYEEQAGLMLTIDLSNQFGALADTIVARAENPYGLIPAQIPGTPFFLQPPGSDRPLAGSNVRLLEAAEFLAQAYRYKPNREYLLAAYDQINWILGNNPVGECLILGLDEPAPPEHVGIVLHGIGPCAAEDDRPCFPPTATETEPDFNRDWSLENNARYLSALGYIKRIPVARPKK